MRSKKKNQDTRRKMFDGNNDNRERRGNFAEAKYSRTD